MHLADRRRGRAGRCARALRQTRSSASGASGSCERRTGAALGPATQYAAASGTTCVRSRPRTSTATGCSTSRSPARPERASSSAMGRPACARRPEPRLPGKRGRPRLGRFRRRRSSSISCRRLRQHHDRVPIPATGTGHSRIPRPIDNAEYPPGVLAADFDDDGRLDLGVAGFNQTRIQMGHGDGEFRPGRARTRLRGRRQRRLHDQRPSRPPRALSLPAGTSWSARATATAHSGSGFRTRDRSTTTDSRSAASTRTRSTTSRSCRLREASRRARCASGSPTGTARSPSPTPTTAWRRHSADLPGRSRTATDSSTRSRRRAIRRDAGLFRPRGRRLRRSRRHRSRASPLGAVAADFDGDGHVDILTTNVPPSATMYFRGLGGGAFAPGEPVPVFNLRRRRGRVLHGLAGRAVDAANGGWGILLNSHLSPTVGSRSVVTGRRASCSVAASDLGALSYQWRKGGVPLSDGGTISGSQTATLTIDPVAFDDAGSYDVVVTTPAAKSPPTRRRCPSSSGTSRSAPCSTTTSSRSRPMASPAAAGAATTVRLLRSAATRWPPSCSSPSTAPPIRRRPAQGSSTTCPARGLSPTGSSSSPPRA